MLQGLAPATVLRLGNYSFYNLGRQEAWARVTLAGSELGGGGTWQWRNLAVEKLGRGGTWQLRHMDLAGCGRGCACRPLHWVVGSPE